LELLLGVFSQGNSLTTLVNDFLAILKEIIWSSLDKLLVTSILILNNDRHGFSFTCEFKVYELGVSLADVFIILLDCVYVKFLDFT